MVIASRRQTISHCCGEVLASPSFFRIHEDKRAIKAGDKAGDEASEVQRGRVGAQTCLKALYHQAVNSTCSTCMQCYRGSLAYFCLCVCGRM